MAAKNEQKLQTEPGDTVAPQTTADTSKLNPTELQALAGDENARRALGLPTTAGLSAARVGTTGTGGYGPGQTAPQSVFESTAGRIVRVDAGETPPAGFSGTLLVAAGDTVSGLAAARIAEK